MFAPPAQIKIAAKMGRCEINFAFAGLNGILSAMLSHDEIKSALAAVKYPGYSRDIVSFGLIKEISAANGAVSVVLQLTSPNPDAARQIKTEAEQVCLLYTSPSPRD